MRGLLVLAFCLLGTASAQAASVPNPLNSPPAAPASGVPHLLTYTAPQQSGDANVGIGTSGHALCPLDQNCTASGTTAPSTASTHTSNFSPDATKKRWPCDATSNDVTITIPAAASFANIEWQFPKLDGTSHACKIVMTGSDRLIGQTEVDLVNQYDDAIITNFNGAGSWFFE